MNDKNKKSSSDMDERIWDYIDGLGPADERSAIEELLQSNMEWKRKYQELLETHQLMKATDLESPSMRFGKNVMEEISRLHIAPATRTYINKKIIWGIGFFFITLFIGFLVYGFGQISWNTEGNSTISENLGKVKLDNFFSNTWVNVFMMINVVLGLFLLDHYLTSKKKEFRKNSL